MEDKTREAIRFITSLRTSRTGIVGYQLSAKQVNIRNTMLNKIAFMVDRLEKYEKMWEEVKKYYGSGYFYYTENNKDCVTFVHRMMTGMERKYFKPKSKNKEEKINDIMTAVRDSYAYLDRPNNSERDKIIGMLVKLRDEGENI